MTITRRGFSVALAAGVAMPAVLRNALGHFSGHAMALHGPHRRQMAEESPSIGRLQALPQASVAGRRPSITDRQSRPAATSSPAASATSRNSRASDVRPCGMAIEQGSVRVGRCAAGRSPWREIAVRAPL